MHAMRYSDVSLWRTGLHVKVRKLIRLYSELYLISQVQQQGAEWTLQPMSKILRCMSKRSGSYIYVDAINFNEEESTLQSLPEINKAAEINSQKKTELPVTHLPARKFATG